ncbi:MAG: TrmB family transcriptional regulator, partial [Halodesulfurarchaeum sp.]
TVSEESDVPRSQVYGAAETLAERGLIEVVEAAPKEYHPVSLRAARQQLRNRLDRETTRAFDALAEIERRDDRDHSTRAVSVLRGRSPITSRIAELLRDAEEGIVYVAPALDALEEPILSSLEAPASRGVAVEILTAEPAVTEQFDTRTVTVHVMDEDNPAAFAGRALLVDDRAVLLAVDPTSEEESEEALWTADTTMAHILARFMRSGMESGLDRTD